MKAHLPFEIPLTSGLPRGLVQRFSAAGLSLEVNAVLIDGVVVDPDFIERLEGAMSEREYGLGSLNALLEKELASLFHRCAHQLSMFCDRDARPNLSRSLQSAREVADQYRKDEVSDLRKGIDALQWSVDYFSKRQSQASNFATAEAFANIIAQDIEKISFLKREIVGLNNGTEALLNSFRPDSQGRTHVNPWLRDCCQSLFDALGKAGASRKGVKWDEIAVLVQAAYIASGRGDETVRVSEARREALGLQEERELLIDTITGEKIESWVKSLRDSPMLVSNDLESMRNARATTQLS